MTKAPIYVLYVALIYPTIQFIDNNFIVPYVIGSKVKLNALFSILAVIAGAALWGVAGMFLSIPLLAIVKLICDKIEPLKPYGFLLGDIETFSDRSMPAFSIKRFMQRFRSKKDWCPLLPHLTCSHCNILKEKLCVLGRWTCDEENCPLSFVPFFELKNLFAKQELLRSGGISFAYLSSAISIVAFSVE